MQQFRKKSPSSSVIILGLTLVFGSPLISIGHAQVQPMVSPQGEVPPLLPVSSATAAALKNQARAGATTFIELSEVLSAAKLNLDVAMARSQIFAAKADLLAADHAPIPTLSSKASQMDLQNGIGPGSIWNDKRIDKSIGLDWTWERGDKRELRAQTAKKLLNASQFDLSDTLIGQQILAYNAFIDLYTAQLKEDEFYAIAESYQKTSDSANIRLKNGDLSAQETYRISIENQRAQADAQAAKLERQNAALALSQIVKLSSSPLTWRVKTGFTVLKSTKNDPFGFDSSQAVIENAAFSRPDVVAAMERENAARVAFDLALSLKKTDLTWGASIDHYPGTSNRLLELRVQLPLQVNYSFEGEIKRAKEQLTQTQLMLDKVKLLATTELQSLLQNVLTSHDRHLRYEEMILPQAKKVLEQAEFAYSKGALTLTDLLDARRTFRATRIEAISSQSELLKAQASWYLRTEPFEIEQLSNLN